MTEQKDLRGMHHGSCESLLNKLPSESVTAIVTDPPYAYEFMGKGWDKVLPSMEVWEQCLRVLLPGGVLLAFGGTRTYHRLTCSIEDAGFEIRDCLMWVYGSGFPKSHNVSKAIDKAAGAEREVLGHTSAGDSSLERVRRVEQGYRKNLTACDPKKIPVTAPATDAAKLWQGYGTALKPAWEPIVMAMKPLDGTFAANALAHGVAGINVDGCRIPGEPVPINKLEQWSGFGQKERPAYTPTVSTSGRWPANVVHDGSDEVLAGFPIAGNNWKRNYGEEDYRGKQYGGGVFGGGGYLGSSTYCDFGSAARFFYCAKASKKERGEGNNHPTVKPLALMRWLVRMVKMPKGTVVLDPFAGSGTTGVACAEEGVDFIGFERDLSSFKIACSRIEDASR